MWLKFPYMTLSHLVEKVRELLPSLEERSLDHSQSTAYAHSKQRSIAHSMDYGI